LDIADVSRRDPRRPNVFDTGFVGGTGRIIAQAISIQLPADSNHGNVVGGEEMGLNRRRFAVSGPLVVESSSAAYFEPYTLTLSPSHFLKQREAHGVSIASYEVGQVVAPPPCLLGTAESCEGVRRLDCLCLCNICKVFFVHEIFGFLTCCRIALFCLTTLTTGHERRWRPSFLGADRVEITGTPPTGECPMKTPPAMLIPHLLLV
jgi:hypothetical protein